MDLFNNKNNLNNTHLSIVALMIHLLLGSKSSIVVADHLPYEIITFIMETIFIPTITIVIMISILISVLVAFVLEHVDSWSEGVVVLKDGIWSMVFFMVEV
jgi:hypothetical protein